MHMACHTIDAMQLTIRSGNPTAEACDALMVPVAADKRERSRAVPAVLALGDFDGKHPAGARLKAQRVLLVGGDRGGDSARDAWPACRDPGLGHDDRLGGDGAAGTGGRRLRAGARGGAGPRFLPVRPLPDPPGTRDRRGVGHAAGRHGRGGSRPAGGVRPRADSQRRYLSGARSGQRTAQPPHPDGAGRPGRGSGRRGGLQSRVLGPAELADQGFGALLGVAQGSAEEPRFIVPEHAGEEATAAPLVLVGKGLTFDG